MPAGLQHPYRALIEYALVIVTVPILSCAADTILFRYPTPSHASGQRPCTRPSRNPEVPRAGCIGVDLSPVWGRQPSIIPPDGWAYVPRPPFDAEPVQKLDIRVSPNNGQ